jgi:hypothetical protein
LLIGAQLFCVSLYIHLQWVATHSEPTFFCSAKPATHQVAGFFVFEEPEMDEHEDNAGMARRHIDRIDRTIVALVSERIRLAGGPALAPSAERIAELIIEASTAGRHDR